MYSCCMCPGYDDDVFVFKQIPQFLTYKDTRRIVVFQLLQTHLAFVFGVTAGINSQFQTVINESFKMLKRRFLTCYVTDSICLLRNVFSCIAYNPALM